LRLLLLLIQLSGTFYPKLSSLSSHLEVGILNYALILEHLEDKFYREGLANFTQADCIKAAFAETSTTT
jgi:hypothetical protein